MANDRLRVRDHSGVLLPSLQEEAAATRAQAAAARTEATEAETARTEAEAARARETALRQAAEAEVARLRAMLD